MTLDLIIKIVGAITGVGALIGMFVAIVKWYIRQQEQDTEIQKIKNEQTIITYGVLACLRGLKEQGCNGPVIEAINELEKHLNVQAHK